MATKRSPAAKRLAAGTSQLIRAEGSLGWHILNHYLYILKLILALGIWGNIDTTSTHPCIVNISVYFP